jgi:hypothetical protein
MTLYEQLKQKYNEYINEQNAIEQDRETRYGTMLKTKLENKIDRITQDDYKHNEIVLLSFKYNEYFHRRSLESRCLILRDVIDKNKFSMPIIYKDMYGELYGGIDYGYRGCRAYIKLDSE